MSIKVPTFWKNASLRRKRIYSIIFMAALSILALLLGTLISLPPQQAQDIANELNQTVTQNTGSTLIAYIFQNNFKYCLLMFIPVVGFAFGMFLLFSTGIAFRAVFDVQMASSINASAAPEIQASTAILVLVGAGAVFLLEFASYSIAMAESIWLFRRILQRKWRDEIKNLAIMIGIVALLLLIGAVVETLTITVPT